MCRTHMLHGCLLFLFERGFSRLTRVAVTTVIDIILFFIMASPVNVCVPSTRKRFCTTGFAGDWHEHPSERVCVCSCVCVSPVMDW